MPLTKRPQVAKLTALLNMLVVLQQSILDADCKWLELPIVSVCSYADL